MKSGIPPRAVKKFARIVGAERAQFDPANRSVYTSNVCGVDRDILGVVFPRSSAEVQKIVRVARSEGAALYPVSTGKNWGLGARLPVPHKLKDKQIVIDLSLMNQIHEFDSKAGVIIIEPGVTQKQIADFLKKSRAQFGLNVTGSSKDSSVLGNSLERGVAHYGCRVPEILSLEVVLGTGEVLNAGGASAPTSRSRLTYPFGIGPDLRGLFFQSNFGIVTRAALRLMPSREAVGIATIQASPRTTLRQFVDALADAKRCGLIPANLHISNRARRLSVATPLYAQEMGIPFHSAKKEIQQLISSGWAATTSYSEERGNIASTFNHLKARLRTVAESNLLFKEDVMNERKNRVVQAMRGTFLHACGVPSDDALLSLGYGQRRLIRPDPVGSGVGTLFLVPILPFSGRDVQAAMRIIDTEFKRFGFSPYVTLNLVEHSSLEAVVNLTFERGDKLQKRRAHACILRAFSKLLYAGYPPQRMSVFQMAELKEFRALDLGHRKAIHDLKRIFDPDHIIAPGRYEFGGGRQ